MLNKQDIARYLVWLGADPSLKGFNYTIDAIMIKQEAYGTPWMELYEKIGKMHGKGTYSVERAIRFFLRNIIARGDKEHIDDAFGNLTRASMKNSRLISRLYVCIKSAYGRDSADGDGKIGGNAR